jgi:enoyl-CoA hydratase
MNRYESFAPEILVEVRGPIRIVTMNRPEALNACDARMHFGLAMVWRALAEDEDARAIVLTGAGPAFSAGGDADWLDSINRDPSQAAGVISEATTMIRNLLQLPQPLVAAVNGDAIGLGCSLLSLSDLVVMADDASVADPHVAGGLVAGDGGLLLAYLTGVHRVKQLLYLGEAITAQEAHAWGLANKLAPRADVLPQAIALAERLASIPVRPLQDTKSVVNGWIQSNAWGSLQAGLFAERETIGGPDVRALLDAGSGYREHQAG